MGAKRSRRVSRVECIRFMIIIDNFSCMLGRCLKGKRD